MDQSNALSFKVGDTVRCCSPGSWVDGRTGTIDRLDVVSTDKIHGHQVRISGVGMTVLQPHELVWLPPPASVHEDVFDEAEPVNKEQ